MPYFVRPMLKEDIKQVAEIDREAFPTMLPAPNFERELRNQMNHYIVVCNEDEFIESTEVNQITQTNPGLIPRIKRFFNPHSSSGNELSAYTGQYINGFVGYWVMGDEAHITTIAVRESLRRKGIGELLMIAVFNRVMELQVNTVTLEVRVSNNDAQNLYEKYGFVKVGVRKGYYTDNREDALTMSKDDINSAIFQSQLKQLVKAHTGRWGEVVYRFPGN